MNKAELTATIANRLKLPIGRAELAVSQVFVGMTGALSRGDGIEVRGFGSFSVRQYRGYTGCNPRTGQPVEVKPKRLPFFTVGKELRERVWAAGRVVEQHPAPATTASPSGA